VSDDAERHALLQLEDSRLTGWRPWRPYLVPVAWELRVERVVERPEGGTFDNRDRLLVYTEVRDGPGGSWTLGPMFDYVRQTAHELPMLDDALGYVARALGSSEILPAVETLRDRAEGGGADAKRTDMPGVAMSLNELLLAGYLQRHLTTLLDAEVEARASGTAQVEWRALASGRAAAELAYELGRVVREAELKAAHERAADAGAKVGQGAVKGGQKRGAAQTKDAEAWRTPFLHWLQPEIDAANADLSEPMTFEAVINFAERNWPSEGFATQKAKPERSTLATAIRWGPAQNPPLFTRAPAKRGKRKR